MIFTKNNKFGNRLRLLRIQSGLTQAQLAEKLNIASSTIGMYEQGRREPDNNTLIQISHEFKVSIDYLLGTGHDFNKTSYLEIDDIITDFIDFLDSKDGLTFEGEPITKEEKSKIVSALRIAIAISIVEYKKNRPNGPHNKNMILNL